LKSDYKSENAPVVGTELIGTSISSGADGIDHAPNVLPQLAENPIKFYNNQRS
jgi:alkaline phosphatase D